MATPPLELRTVPPPLQLLPWVRRTCTPGRRPALSPAAWRSLAAITGPVAAGLLTGRPAEGVMVALGALSAVLTDAAATYRHRLVGMGVPQLLGVAGAFATGAAEGSWAAPWVLPALGVLAGVLSRAGTEGSLAAMILLMDAELVLDLPLPGPVWRGPGLLLLGGLLVLAPALVGRLFLGHRPDRVLLARCLAACADALAPAGPGLAERRALHDALDQAHRTATVGGSTLLARHLPGLLALSELASAAGAGGLRASAPLADRLREEAARLAAGRPGPYRTWPTARQPFDEQVLRAARAALAPVRPVRPARVRYDLTDRQALFAGLRVGLALLLAGTAAHSWQLPHPYWAVLNVTFVCRPDLGPVTTRALERFAGTAVAALLGGFALAAAGSAWALVAVLGASALLVPAFAPTGYLYQTAALATFVLMATQLAGDPALPLLLPLLANCAIGCLASVLACELFRPHPRRLTLAGHLDRARAPHPAAPHPHLELARARAEFARAHREPPWRRLPTAHWSALIAEAEHAVDTALAAAHRPEAAVAVS